MSPGSRHHRCRHSHGLLGGRAPALRSARGRRPGRHPRPAGLGRSRSRCARKRFRSPRVLVEAQRRAPRSATEPAQRGASGSTSMIDISDGLACRPGPCGAGLGRADRPTSGCFEFRNHFRRSPPPPARIRTPSSSRAATTTPWRPRSPQRTPYRQAGWWLAAWTCR